MYTVYSYLILKMKFLYHCLSNGFIDSLLMIQYYCKNLLPYIKKNTFAIPSSLLILSSVCGAVWQAIYVKKNKNGPTVDSCGVQVPLTIVSSLDLSPMLTNWVRFGTFQTVSDEEFHVHHNGKVEKTSKCHGAIERLREST